MTGGTKGKIFKYTHKGLPFTKGKFIDENTFLAVGYDKAPFLFKRLDDEWKLSKVLDSGYENFRVYSVKKGDANYFKIKEIESYIMIPEKIKMKERDTQHDNTIQQLVVYKPDSGNKEVCTGDENGKIIFWKL